jgi:hypothetical protein
MSRDGLRYGCFSAVAGALIWIAILGLIWLVAYA